MSTSLKLGLLALCLATTAPLMAQPDLIVSHDQPGERSIRRHTGGTWDSEVVLASISRITGFDIDYATGYVYWSDASQHIVMRRHLDGGAFELLVGYGAATPYKLTLDTAGGKMYWTDQVNGKIQRANLDGTGIEDLVTTGLDMPNEIVLDTAGGKMYWTDEGSGKIQRANLDGSGVEDLVTGQVNPRGIDLDVAGGKMYWIDLAEFPDNIKRANLDGSGVEVLVVATLVEPEGITLDPANGVMYWTDIDAHTRQIQRANLDGSGIAQVFSDLFLQGPVEIDPNTQALYYAHSNSLQRITTTATLPEQIVLGGIFRPKGIAVDEAADKVYWADESYGFIRRVNYDGSANQLVIPSGKKDLRTIAVDVAGGKMYWADALTVLPQNIKIQRSNLDGTGVEDLVTESDLSRPTGLALDLAAGKMYWTDWITDKIQRANLDGSGIEDLVTTGLAGPRGIALDVAGGKMYWTDDINNKIQRANLDGSGVEDLIATGLDNPRGIALDIAGGKMYWTDIGTDKIQRANLDGSGVEDLVTTGLTEALSIMLDLGAGTMYWADNQAQKIQRANLDGSGVTDIVNSEGAPNYLTLAGGKLYWTDNFFKSIQRANLDGSSIETLLDGGMQQPYGLVLDAPNDQVYWTDQYLGTVQRAKTDNTQHVTLVSGLPDPRGLAMDAVAGKLYWTDTAADKIQRSNLDGTGVEDVVSGLSNPIGVAVDPQNGKLYWCNSSSTIFRANLDGSGQETLLVLGAGIKIWGLTLDLQAGKLYWTNEKLLGSKLQRANLDGTSIEDVVTNSANHPRGVAVAPTDGFVFWTDDDPGVFKAELNAPTEVATVLSPPFLSISALAYDPIQEHIYLADDSRDVILRINLDGTGVTTLTSTRLSSSTSIVECLALDLNEGKMYWGDRSGDNLYRANLDGSSPELLLEAPDVQRVRSCALDRTNRHFYFLDETYQEIRRVNLDGTDLQMPVSNAGLSLRAMAVDEQNGKLYWGDLNALNLYRANLDGSAQETLNTSPIAPTKMALSYEDQKLYFVNDDYRMDRANLDGTGREILFGEFAKPIAAFALMADANSFGLALGLRLMLAGPYLEGASPIGRMSNELFPAGLLPATQPFSDPAFDGTALDYDATVTVGNFATSETDWVLVELRSGPGPETTVARQAALLRFGGSVYNMAGENTLYFPGLAPGNYYLVVRHRNHLPVMTATPLALSDTRVFQSFVDAMGSAFGVNPMIEVEPGIHALWPGDGNADGSVTSFDFLNVWLPANGSAGYLQADFNLSGDVTAFDFLQHWLVANGQGSQVPD